MSRAAVCLVPYISLALFPARHELGEARNIWCVCLDEMTCLVIPPGKYCRYLGERQPFEVLLLPPRGGYGWFQ